MRCRMDTVSRMQPDLQLPSFFLLQELAFALKAGTINMPHVAADAPVTAHNPVARHIRGKRVLLESLPHSLS